MDQKKRKRRFLHRLGRTVITTVLFIILFVLIIALLIQTPPVQNMLRQRAVAWLEKKLETKVTIGKVFIGLPRQVELKNVYIEDRQKDTLLAGGSLKANINLFRLLIGGDIDIRKLELENITLKARRLQEDSVFNYQFFINAFTTRTKTPDLEDTTSFFIGIPSVELNNVRLVYNDVVSGSDIEAWIGHLDSKIDKFDPANLIVEVPQLNVEGLRAKVYQLKTLSTPDPLSKDITEAKEPIDLQLDFKEINLKSIYLDYRNDISAFYSTLDIGDLRVTPQMLDITNRVILLDSFSVRNSTAAFRFGRKEKATEVVKQIKQELESQAKAGWRIQIAALNLEDDNLWYDNDNKPEKAGINYAHVKVDSFTLQVDNFLFDRDSVAGKIRKAKLIEKNSGFVLEELKGDVLFAHNQAYIKDLFLKTPGTELKQYASLTYGSYKALNDSFSRVNMEANIASSYVQVKDILAFAPQLRTEPAFADPNATWYINLQGNGTLQSLYIENLQFRGLKNTVIDAKGSIAAVNDPNRTGARLTINRLHTTQSDIALFIGRRLSTDQMNLPEEFDANGTLAGSVNNLSVNLNISSSAGAAVINGHFTNFLDQDRVTYTALVRTNSLDLGSIIRNTRVGKLSASLAMSGRGFRPGSYESKFSGNVFALGYNNYTYRNIKLSGNINGLTYWVDADVKDPNLDLQGIVSGNFSAAPSVHFEGFVDSLKAMPLHLTTVPLVFRGKVNADIPVMNDSYLEANVLLTDALFISAAQRLPLDTLRFISGRNDSVQYMQLNSDVANVRMSGQYRYADLGKIFQASIEPYFSVAPRQALIVQPYDFSFTADIGNSPLLTAFVPGLKSFEPIHAEGRLATGQGLTATVTTPYIFYLDNEISGLNLNINTTDKGLQLIADVQRLKNSTMNIYHTQLNAIALNNKIDFSLNIDDKLNQDKYYFTGLLTQPSPGIYTLSLKPDSLMLNYQKWFVSPGNSLTFTKDNILASNFILQRNEQQLSLQSEGQQLNVGFTNFQLSTITAFMKSDTLMANGSMNGVVHFKNILKQPVFTSDLTINDLSIRGDTLGNAVIKVDNISGNSYNTNATITGRGNDVSMTGTFTPKGDNDIGLDLNLAIRQLQLSTIEGAFGGFLKNASGSVNGDVRISGSMNNPVIDGPINFNKASFAISILGSQYRVDGEKLMVTQNGFRFDDFMIRDTANNTMRLNGVVQTTNFTNFLFDLDINAENFKILNTTKKQNKIYYGSLVISTELHVDGTELNPIIDGNLTVNEGTDLTIVIPQRQPGVVSREGIVEFVDLDHPEYDTLFKAYDSLNISPFVGMDITTTIEIEKEAIFNIVIDEANGDFISLQGEATLSTGIDPSGKITLIGAYELDKGAYEITFSFLRRRFEIQKGSRIVWLNEPTKANMDVTAVYIANTSPIDLVQNLISASTPAIRNTYLQKLPFEVRLHMTGELLQPVVEFDIVLPDNKSYGVSNDIITQVQTRLEQLRIETGEINKQVFALLLLNRFVGQNPLSSSGPGFSASSFARQSVSKLLTEQLNKVAAGLIDGVDLTFDVVSTDDYTTGERRNRTDLNIGLSKRLMSDRLTVSVGSNFELEGPKNTNQKPSNVLGNLSVSYVVSRDGRYLIRFYRKNQYEGIVDGYIIETGLSFLISVDYDNFRELLRSRRKQKLVGVE